MYNLKLPQARRGVGGVLYRPTQHAPEEEGGGGGSRLGIFIKICINCAFLCLFQPFLWRSFIANEQTAQNLILSVRSLRFALFVKERHCFQNEGSLKSD